VGQGTGSAGGSGARLNEIRNAAQGPLLAIAPSAAELRSIASAATTGSHSADYLRSAVGITFPAGPAPTDPLRTLDQPFEPHEDVTVRVTYLFRCDVPVVRKILYWTGDGMCRSLTDAIAAYPAELTPGSTGGPERDPTSSTSLLSSEDTYMVLRQQATMPNQGATYIP
jgi:hypothetical protein